MTNFVARMFRRRALNGVNVPSMDGALKPNRALEEADLVSELDAPDSVVLSKGRLVIASAKRLVEVGRQGNEISALHSLPAEVSCMCTLPDGSFVVGMVDGSITVLNGRFSGLVIQTLDGKPIVCPTAMSCVDDSSIILCIGSSVHGPEHWRHDLMSHGKTGSVWKIDLRSRNGKQLANRLAFPNGIVLAKGGRVIVSESWKHRIVELESSGQLKVLLDELPGYPARLTPSENGNGIWLSIFAPRRPAIELILQDDQFRADMMQGIINEQYWMAPALSSGRDFKEPLLGGAVKQLGIAKPWAPTRSYGLLVRLNSDFKPTSSFHSRGDGSRHGVTDCVEVAGHLYVVSKGGNAVLDITLTGKEIQV